MSRAPLSAWPWGNIGPHKYLLYGPLVAQVVRLWLNGGDDDESSRITSSWCFQILVLCAARGMVHQLWTTYSTTYFLIRKYRILKQGVDFKQVDQEWDWDNFLILFAFVCSLLCYLFPTTFVTNLPRWDNRGIITTLILHVFISEPLYYYLHRLFHGNFLFSRYHSLHHSSPVPQPFTAEHATLLEHLLLIPIIAIPLLGTTFIGYGSIGLVYAYLLLFDFLKCLGSCNVEVIPYQIFDALPFLKYLLYTPTYHTIHHSEKDSNFCLFMPLFDALGKTLNTKSWTMHRQIRMDGASEKKTRIPDFVFLAHMVDISSSLHAPFANRSLSSLPYSTPGLLLILWPIAFSVMLMMWAWAKPFRISFYNLRSKLHETWVVPRYGYQYFLPFATRGINKQIEYAILQADRLGVKVLSLAALNKNEALNGGGMLFVNKHPNLKVRIVHGNTLTAAVTLNQVPKDVKEVFLTGATSKLGRAIALYLSRRKVRVLMLTLSTERFQKIQKEAPVDCQKYLVQVTKYQAAKNCKTWIVGKWITPREQSWAPSGTHFHQFVVPPILRFRRDCTYGDLAAMKLPQDVEGLSTCEYTMGRGVVHACHAGGVVHSLEGWTHHEVGAIDVDRIDVVWEAAMKNGLKPV